MLYLGYECQQAIKIKIMSVLLPPSLVPFLSFPKHENKGYSGVRMPGLCPRCSKAVYFAEEIKTKGEVFHKLCFNCSGCKKLLEPGNFSENDGNIYCRTCYGWVIGGALLTIILRSLII